MRKDVLDRIIEGVESEGLVSSRGKCDIYCNPAEAAEKCPYYRKKYCSEYVSMSKKDWDKILVELGRG